MRFPELREQTLDTCMPVRSRIVIRPRSSSSEHAPSIFSRKSSSRTGYFVEPMFLVYLKKYLTHTIIDQLTSLVA